jgi:hypothetical protein
MPRKPRRSPRRSAERTARRGNVEALLLTVLLFGAGDSHTEPTTPDRTTSQICVQPTR